MFKKRIYNQLFEIIKKPGLSVIIPTRNRSSALSALLGSIERQNLDHPKFEVIVIDDGSNEEESAAVENLITNTQWKFPLAFYLQEQTGPAIVRNRSIEYSRADIILFLNDDVTLNGMHLSAHLELHRQYPEPNIAVRGKTLWEPEKKDTAVMRCLRNKTFRYNYQLQSGEEHWCYFQTCDLSLKKRLLIEYPFDEDFPYASFEDTELGYRLYKNAGMRLIMSDQAVSYHHHHYTARDLIRRARINGKSAAILLEKHPDLSYRVRDYFYTMSLKKRIMTACRHLLTFGMEKFWDEIDWVIYLRNLEKESKHKD